MKKAENAWKKYYKLDKNTFEEILHRFLKSLPDTNKVMTSTGIDYETLIRIIRLLKSNLAKIDRNGNIFSKGRYNSIDKKIKNLLKNPPFRPSPELKYGQWYCSWKTSVGRAQKLANDLPLDNKKISSVKAKDTL